MRVLVDAVGLVVVVLGFSEPKRRRPGVVRLVVLAENGAVGCAKMAHLVKLADWPFQHSVQADRR